MSRLPEQSFTPLIIQNSKTLNNFLQREEVSGEIKRPPQGKYLVGIEPYAARASTGARNIYSKKSIKEGRWRDYGGQEIGWSEFNKTYLSNNYFSIRNMTINYHNTKLIFLERSRTNRCKGRCSYSSGKVYYQHAKRKIRGIDRYLYFQVAKLIYKF